MKNKCLVISGGHYEKIDLNTDEYFVISCDKGFAYAYADNVRTDLLVGDFDSLGQRPDFSGEIICLPVEKDDTDTMFAIKEAIRRGYKDITIVCALGGRKDHEFANYQGIVYAQSQGASCRILSSEVCLYGLSGNVCPTLSLKTSGRRIFSVFAMSDRCEGVSISGAFYEVSDVSLTNSFPLGQSNYATGDELIISVKEGILLIMVLAECHP